MASPFEIAQGISNQFGKVNRNSMDRSSIDAILEQSKGGASQEDIMANILRNVSPERRQETLAVFQNIASKKAEKDKAQRLSTTFEELKIPQGLVDSPDLAKEFFKRNSDLELLNQIDFNSPDVGNVSVDSSENISPNGITTTESISTQMPVEKLRGLPREVLTKRTGHPNKLISEPAKEALRQLDSDRKFGLKELESAEKSREPFMTPIIERGSSAQTQLENREKQLEIINRNQLNSPAVAIALQELPFKLGEQFLSEDTVEYRGTLIDDYRDLKDIFKGQTRSIEIQKFEDKIPDLYLNDEQKKVMIKSRIKAEKAKLAEYDSALEIAEENPLMRGPEFKAKVARRTEEKKKAILDSFIDETTEVFRQADIKRNMPLDQNDPDDQKVITQLMIETTKKPDPTTWTRREKRDMVKYAKKKGFRFQ